ncbi:unnamed protein product, partial [Pylaiella littoralis]
LSQPFLLGAYRGDFPEEILRVILESPAVQSSWAACWTARDGDGEAIAVDPKVSREVFEFVTRKYQNCRMGDWNLDLTDTSTMEWEKEYSQGVKECDDDFMKQPVVLPGEIEGGSE